MGTLKQATDEQLRALGERLVRNMERRILERVPSRSNLPSRTPGPQLTRTNTLKDSVRVTFEPDGNGVWELSIKYEDYGDYTIFGTRPHRLNSQDTGLFGMKFEGYRDGRGTGRGRGTGIRPQGWLSLYGDRPVYEAIVEAELKMTWETFLGKKVSGFKKGQIS